MKVSLALVMKFWTDGQENSDRIRNVRFTWNKLKDLSSFLSKNNIENKSFLYDFSPEKIIEDSIHIPFPLGVYKKAEKTNIILDDIYNFTHLFMFDCDTFFSELDYEKLIDLLNNLQLKNIITFDLGKLENEDTLKILSGEQFDKEKMNYRFAYSGDKSFGPLAHGLQGSLGGVYIVPIQQLNEVGRFNKKFVGWGEEDGEVMDRLRTKIKHEDIISCKEIFPIHLSHFSDWSNPLYFKRFADEN